MKKTELRRGRGLKRSSTPMKPGKPLARGKGLKQVGARKKREAGGLKAFRERPTHTFCCAKCGIGDYAATLDPHHMVPRSLAAGHPNTHHIGNRCWLCRLCHDEAHRGLHPDLIKSRDFLDSLTVL